ncbi:MAG: hypothetical protein WBP08_00065 [Saprospiraceae bacterium]
MELVRINILLTILLFAGCSKNRISKEQNSNILRNEYVDISTFGAIANDGIDDSDAIQRTIDFAINIGTSSHVYCPPGIYDLNKGIVIANQNDNGEYFFTTLTLSGDISTYASNQNIGQTTVFRLRNPTFGIALQSARNCVVENIVFEGCAKYTTDPKTIIDWTMNDWGIKANAITNRFSPSCAIVIDPFHKDVPTGDQYIEFSNKYTNTSKGGSSMILIRGCSFYKHYIAVANNPSGSVQNGDNIRSENCHVSTCHTFWSCGQTQSRGNSIDNVYALFLHTFISDVQIGNQIGTPPTISNLNLAGFCKQVIDIKTGFSGVNFYRSYLESIWSLGVSNGLSTSFDQCQISFNTPNVDFFMPPFQLWADNTVAFRDCNIQYFANCTVKMPIVFKARSLILSGGSIEGGVVVSDGITNAGGDDLHKVSYDNMQIKCMGKVAGKKVSEKPHVNISNEIIMGGEVIISSDGGMYLNSGTTYNVDYMEDASIQINYLDKTADFISKDGLKYRIGDNIFTLQDVNPTSAGFSPQGTIRSALGYVSRVEANKITVSGVPMGFKDGKESLYIVSYPLLKSEILESRTTTKNIRYFEKK